ncbi:hypothetical protein ABT095_23985 [Kitasatospora sp. NPDC002227]|uniref:hypothetical protein n=1 Tax=Kitasatospora sp. NPDC002227 TaxID=3154773 RepID=UPI0033214756
MSHVANVMISVEPDGHPALGALGEGLWTAAPLRGRTDGAVGRTGPRPEITGSRSGWAGFKSPECGDLAVLAVAGERTTTTTLGGPR